MGTLDGGRDRFNTAIARRISKHVANGTRIGYRAHKRSGPLSSLLAIALVFTFALPLISASVSASEVEVPEASGESPPTAPDAPTGPPAAWDAFESVPDVTTDSTSTFSYDVDDPVDLTLGTEDTTFSDPVIEPAAGGGGGGGGGGGNKLGNAPGAHYDVLEKFLERGHFIPPNFPVPYLVYTRSDDNIDRFSDVFAKQPIMINVDGSSGTGQGAKDIRVKTEQDTNPLVLTTRIERLGGTSPNFLRVWVMFPAFFYNDEAGVDPAGEPFWVFGYETLPGSEIPLDITMTFTVDQTLGKEHVFVFTWSAPDGIDPLGFTLQLVQVPSGDFPPEDLASAFLPATVYFEVSSPTLASLTFTTLETATSTTKCMVWTAAAPFELDFAFSEEEVPLGGLQYDASILIQDVPTAMDICTVEDRLTNEYSVVYNANAPIGYLNIHTELIVAAVAEVTIDLTIEDMPSHMDITVGDGYMNFNVNENVGLLDLEASADLGMAGIDSMVNLNLEVEDIPDFSATWFQDDTGNGFSLVAVSCIGRIEFAFSFGAITYPAEHAGFPAAHYLWAQSLTLPDPTTIALRIFELESISFVQDNEVSSNTIDVVFCEQRQLFILVDTEPGSLLTDNQDVDLRIDVDLAPTHLTVSWTTPFTLSLATDLPIGAIHADLTFVDATVPRDLTADVDILFIPANMAWDIDPSGSLSFTADSEIGTVSIEASDPNGLPGAETFFSGVPLRLLDGLAHEVPSFTAGWASASAPGFTSVSFNTVAPSPLWDLAFALSTSETSFATVGGAEENRVMFYSDNFQNLGTGLVLETSLWLRIEDVSRADFASGGAVPTFVVGFDTSLAHEVRARAEFDRTSPANPAPASDDVRAVVVTTAMPTVIDLTVAPSESFDYEASAGISHIDIDGWIGDLSPAAPSPADVDRIMADIFDLPATASGQWDATGDAGFFHLQTSSGLGRAEVEIDNAFGVFGSEFVHMEAFIDALPENANADWDVGGRTGAIAFTDALFSGGLGEAFVLATTMDETDTENYVNSLNIDPTVCMTTYSEYEHQIDARYWPGTVLADNLQDLYCRNPELDTTADDYVVYRVGGGEKLFTGRIRSLHEAGVNLGNTAGFAEIEFSSSASRQMYIRVEDTGSDDLTLVEVSEIPTRIFADYSLPGGAAGDFSFEASTVVDFIDVYSGSRSPTSQSEDWKKFLVKDLPSSASLVFNFGSIDGVADFLISNTFEVGFAIQDSSKRYAGWVQVTGLHFDYHLHGPGAHSTSYDIGYHIAHIEVDLHTVPDGTAINGILGIYNLKNSPGALTTSPPATPGSAYIPEWTFMLIDFEQFLLQVEWDIGVSFFSDSKILEVGLFPTIVLVTDFSIVVDYWWNTAHTINLPLVPLPIPFTPMPCLLGAPVPWFLDGEIRLNPVADYRENDQIHLLPWTQAFELEFDMSGDVVIHCDPFDDVGPDFVWIVEVDVEFDVEGFHDSGDHGDPSPV